MINFVTQERILNVNGEKQKKYNAKIVYKDVLTLDKMGEEVSRLSTLHPAEAELAVNVIVDAMCSALCNGRIVDLGKLGRFKPSIKTKVVDDPQQVDAKTITDITCIYKPGKEIKQALKDTPIHREREVSEKTKKESRTIDFYSKKAKLEKRLAQYTEQEKKLIEEGLIDKED